MSRLPVPCRPSSLPLLVAAIWALAPAQADAQVSAAEVWAEWQAGAAEAGQTLTAEVTETGEGLVLQNLAARSEEDDVVTTAQVDRVALIEQGDGTLSVEVSNPYALSITFPIEDEDAPEGAEEALVTVGLLLTHEGLDVTVAGTPETRRYSYSADALTLVEGAVTRQDGEPTAMIDLEVVTRDVQSDFALTGTGEDGRFAATGSTGSVTGRLEAEAPADEGDELRRLAVTFALGDLATEAEGSRGALGPGGLPEGAEITSATTYGMSQVEIALREPETEFDASLANEGGSFGFTVAEDRIAYDIAATAPRSRVSGPDLPAPVEIAAASSALSFSLPIVASETTSQALLRIDYRDVVFGEALWAMIDPAGQVPRDPLTLILDATAQVRLLADLMSAEAVEMEGPIGALRALTVSELELSYGDASLTGTADVTFRPGEAMPEPVGQAELRLSGGNALLEVLERAGFVTAEQAAVARGVAGMFSRPGARPDTMETTIEFLEDGTITANGLTLQ
jgi:hypothetical protein